MSTVRSRDCFVYCVIEIIHLQCAALVCKEIKIKMLSTESNKCISAKKSFEAWKLNLSEFQIKLNASFNECTTYVHNFVAQWTCIWIDHCGRQNMNDMEFRTEFKMKIKKHWKICSRFTIAAKYLSHYSLFASFSFLLFQFHWFL